MARGSDADGYEYNVFVNCPFDRRYLRFFRAIIFTVHDCGFIARCALEQNDGSQIRVSKILQLISECRVGIHDLSRTEVDSKTRLPRFNMPLELGMFLAAKEFGQGAQRRKVCLVMDREQHRYQRFCSDIAGQDISAHDGDVEQAVRVIRDFLRSAQRELIPGGATIYRRYLAFLRALPKICAEVQIHRDEMTYNDYATFVSEWLKAHANTV